MADPQTRSTKRRKTTPGAISLDYIPQDVQRAILWYLPVPAAVALSSCSKSLHAALDSTTLFKIVSLNFPAFAVYAGSSPANANAPKSFYSSYRGIKGEFKVEDFIYSVCVDKKNTYVCEMTTSDVALTTESGRGFGGGGIKLILPADVKFEKALKIMMTRRSDGLSSCVWDSDGLRGYDGYLGRSLLTNKYFNGDYYFGGYDFPATAQMNCQIKSIKLDDDDDDDEEDDKDEKELNGVSDSLIDCVILVSTHLTFSMTKNCDDISLDWDTEIWGVKPVIKIFEGIFEGAFDNDFVELDY